MSTRNFILLVILMLMAIGIVFGVLFWYNTPAPQAGSNNTTGTNFISQFNPFAGGGSVKPAVKPAPVDLPGNQPVIPPKLSNLKRISSMPIAGFGVFSNERLAQVITPPASTDTTAPPATDLQAPVPPMTEFATAVRYVDRATGNIYESFADKIAEVKFTSTVVPQIYEAFFGNNGNSVIMRNLKADGKTIETFYGTLPKEILGGDSTVPNEVKGSFLPENITDLSVSGDGSNAFYLIDGDTVTGITLNLATGKKTQVMSSPFTEWLSEWAGRGLVFTTKPAGGVPGYLYGLNQNGTLSQLLGGINGLTTNMSPDGRLVLYSDQTLGLSLYHADTHTSVLMGVNTLPEKCVWNKTSDAVYCLVPKTIPSGNYPDDWYAGEISFTDQIWKLDAVTGNASLLDDPSSEPGGEEMDGIKLALDPDEKYLFFVNKKDSVLWEYALK